MAGDNNPKGPNLMLWMPILFIVGVGLGLLALNTGVLDEIELPSFERPTAAPAAKTRAPSGDYQPMMCDRQAAEAVREKARGLAAFRDRGERLTLTLGPAWEFYSEGLRRSFVETFHEADGCLRGEPRRIDYDYRGSRVAEVDAAGRLRMGDGIQEIK